jgi:putative hemin transport protein
MVPVEQYSLNEQYTALKAQHPQMRIYDAAISLGVSELELLELKLGEEVVRLSGDWKKLLSEMHRLDYVMALTRNPHAVHERKGIYQNVSFMAGGKMGVAVNEDIDLRFFMTDWEYAYAVKMPAGGRTLYSFQFFNPQESHSQNLPDPQVFALSLRRIAKNFSGKRPAHTHHYNSRRQ